MGLLRHRKTYSSPSMVNDAKAMAILTKDTAVNSANSMTAPSICSVSSGQYSDGYVDGFVKTYTASTPSSNLTTPPISNHDQMGNLTYGATSSLSLSNHVPHG